MAEHLSDWLTEENEELIWPFIALGRVYEGQSQFTQSEKYYRLCVETTQNRLEERHPDTATSYNNLALLYESMGRCEEALPLYQLALAICSDVLGENPPNTQTVHKNYEACLQKSQE